jgi:Rrf2 family protein
MKLNTRARYAVRMMADIYKNANGDDPIPLNQVAARQNISKRYLDQLATHLKNAQLLKSVWGMNGGYKLNKPGGEITVLEILEAVEGPVSIIDCVGEPGACAQAGDCDCRVMWGDVNKVLVDKLADYTLDDLVKPRRKKR